ncbi:SUN domain-containing ossification factor [Trichonephila clavata]|uniref:SUN domain-containing ossification factor n=1 Tax=Trichonephila clavata TaxID=2740835 RepID=A0A8X6J2W2_TRICU|nr:SUN domain-containing ossification factor [Trichonephila clavata]
MPMNKYDFRNLKVNSTYCQTHLVAVEFEWCHGQLADIQRLPNYCDINQNEADIEAIQNHKITPSDLGGIKHVPSQQEKEKSNEEFVNHVKSDVQPNVEYVNNIDDEETKAVTSNDVKSLKPSEHDNFHKEIPQYTSTNLESSRSSNNEANEKIDQLISPELSEKPTEFTSVPVINKPDTVKPSLAAPNVETTIIKKLHAKASKLVESVPHSVAPDSVEAVINAKSEEAINLPHSIPKLAEESIHHQPHYDGMPSFDEWKKMMLAEQQKGGQKMPSPTPPGKKISSQKRRRNYSSFECGAKIVASNAEAEGTSRILNELVDEYMLNPCKAKIWFVIELCETVQATQIELANFELFSSCPKEFAVYSSDNFPTRDWVLLGTFTAAEQRVLQSFELKQEGFGKFIKIELLSYYGKEHYCPLSVVRIFGTSMVDEYEEMETLASHPDISEDDLDRLDISLEDKKSTNIFGSATDAVMNIMKKAAQALGHQPLEDGQNNETIPDQQNASETKLCSVMDNSSEKCEDIPLITKKESLPALHNFSVSPNSMHKSLFRLLHRCDQCISKRIRYYSSAQPHCRFFQAAFGPVIFQGLCDWFKEHPLVFTHESSAHSNKASPQDDSSVIPTKSPPPQILIVPLENDSPVKKLLMNANHSVAGIPSDKIPLINATKPIPSDNNASTKPDKIQLQSSIQPTHTQQTVHTVALNDSKKVYTFVESSETVLPSADVINELPRKSTIPVQEDSDLSLDKIVTETIPIDVSITESLVTSEVFTEADEEQITEFMLDPSSVIADDISLSEMVSSIDLPASVKFNEDKLPDMQSEMQGKLEPVTVSSVSTTGQKESVFMRMSNRIKSLELNMSLSSQYLQELSQRYRRQMEDMQRAFNRTIGTLNDTARKAAERDLKQQDVLFALQLQVSNLTETVETLLNERSSVYRQMIETHVCLMVIEAIIMITIMSLCVRRISSSAGQEPYVRKTHVASPRIFKRRSSVDSLSPPVAIKVKKRSASEEALNAGEDVMIVEPLPVFLEPILKAKKKSRKRSKVQRSVSNPSVQRRNSSPTSRCSEKRVSYSEGCIGLKTKLHRKTYACENCNYDTCTEVKLSERNRKLNKMPFQNLTNGTVYSSQVPPIKNQRLEKRKDRFSFIKFLKFQRRDSI